MSNPISVRLKEFSFQSKKGEQFTTAEFVKNSHLEIIFKDKKQKDPYSIYRIAHGYLETLEELGYIRKVGKRPHHINENGRLVLKSGRPQHLWQCIENVEFSIKSP